MKKRKLEDEEEQTLTPNSKFQSLISQDFSMAGRGRRPRRQVHRGSSSQHPPATPDAGRTRPSEDEFVAAEDVGLSPPTHSSVGGATPSPGLPSASTPATTATASTPAATTATASTPASTPPVAPTRANPYPGLLVEHGVYIRRPGFADPPTLPERPANIDRTELWADGTTFFPVSAGKDLGDVMRENFHGPYINFSDVPLDRRFIWLDQMRKKYWWPDHRESEIRKCYKTVASKRFRDMINDQKALAKHSGDLRKDWLKAEFWEKMKEKMEKPDYKAKCEKASASRAKGGLHTGGSIPTGEHFRRMCEEALRAGGDPMTIDFPTIFQRTHKRKKDGKLVDERAAKAYETYESLADGTESSTPTERNDRWVQAVGRGKGGSVYGTGSLASQPSVLSRAAPTAPPAPSQPVPPGAMSLEQITTTLLEVQRQVRQLAESRDPAAPAPPMAPPAPPMAPPAPPVVPEDLQQIIAAVMAQYMASRQPPPPLPPPST